MRRTTTAPPGNVPDGMSPLPGRRDEEDLLNSLLSALRRGRPALVGVHGPPGIGRSALLDRAAALAERAGVRTVAAQACREETDLPHGVAEQLHAALGTGRQPADLCRALLAAAREQPLLVVVDDVQWADTPSLRALQALARRLAGTSLMLLTARSDALPPGPDDRIEPCPLTDGHAVARHTLDLGPLAQDAVGEILARAWGTAVDPGFREAAAQAVEGNPAVLRSVVRRFGRHGWRPWVDHLPHLTDSAAEAVRERTLRTLAMLPEELLDVLRVVAAAGEDCSTGMIASLAEPRTTGAARALTLLSGTGLLTPGPRPAFREPKAAEAVLARLSTERREELHARAADWAHRWAVPDSGVARMLLGARVLGAAWAVDVLRREAARCRLAGKRAAAARLLQRALREPMPPPLRVRLLTELSAAVLLSEPEAADRHLRQALLVPADAGAGPFWVRAAELLVARGDVVAAQPLIAQCIGRTEPGSADRAALRALYWLAEQSQPEAAHELDRPPVDELPELPEQPAEAAAAAWRTALLGRDVDRARQLARAALGPEARQVVPPTLQVAACHALVLSGDFAEARAALDRVLVYAEHTDSRAVAGLALLVAGLTELRRERPEAATVALARAQEVMPPHCWHPLMTPGLVALMALRYLERGDRAAAERSLALARPAGAEGGLAWAYLLYTRGRVRLAGGQREEALADLLECGRLLLARRVTNPALLPWRSAAALAHGPAPDCPVAAGLLAEERRLALAWGAPGVVTESLLGTLTGGRLHHTHPDAGAPASWQYRQALVALGTAPFSGHRTIDSLLGSGATAARPAPAKPPAARVPGPPHGLTDAELRVAALAADGMANRAIAAELQVTLRTVELHLTKAYRKLGIRGRPQLATALDSPEHPLPMEHS
ncbi:AAA family ATPase [Streptomyces sp. ET3-23]|uniref:AAA family ATPase n=1 Tax=Streptomyces sp. ET3-23 TaxID=2885643 RepID=UPI001D11CF7D|nr:LuxR family transcriptional regulator [Streptomyces sp. ET3-23]MCC2278054.1 AAA family ATPase [Streptomyces sp. ET3-23]